MAPPLSSRTSSRYTRRSSESQTLRCLVEVHEVARVAWELVIKEGCTSDVLKVWVHHPGFYQCLVSQIVHVLQHHASNHESYRHRRATGLGIEGSKLFLGVAPVYPVSQQCQFVVHVYEFFKQRPEKFALIMVR